MYRALIVDDEPLVQVGLQSMIDWATVGVQLLPCASNGQAALDVIVAQAPDLVITDIKMPLMDGLELIRRCRDLPEPRPVFLVLTSHEDFSYAREAVKYRVADYLIKLELTPEVLARSVTEALATLTAPGRPTTPGAPGAGAQWEAVLNQTVSTEEEAKRLVGEPGWEGRTTAVAVARFDQTAKEARPPAIRMLAEILGREYEVRTVAQGPDQVAFVLGVDLDGPTAEARLTASLVSALHMVRKYFNGPVTAGLGTPGPGLKGLAASAHEAAHALAHGTDSGPLRVFRHRENPGAPLAREAFRAGLEQALIAGDSDALASWFQRARESVEVHGKLADALDLGTAALYGVLAAAPQGEALLASIFEARPEGPKSLYSVPSTAHVAAWLTTLEAGLRSHVESLGARHQEKLVEAMKRFIESHHRERLQLKSLADQFRLSPNYAGALFRRFTGRSFSEYSSEVKVAKAREMLASRKYRIYEISEYLGFENTYYFSKVFRRVTGQSPREFASGEDNDQSIVEKC